MQLDPRPGIWATALGLPGLAATVSPNAHAESAPTEGEFSLRYSHYQEFQPEAQRMRVVVPAVFVLVPVNEHWVVQGLYTTDSVSGASPLFYNTLSGASGEGIKDFRRAGDVQVTRYFERWSVALGGAYSREDDFDSDALRMLLTRDSADRNQSWSLGFGRTDNLIDSVNGLAENEQRHVVDWQLGYTRVLSPNEILAASVGVARGRGYHSDPYKPLDQRPDSRDQRTLGLRYHRNVERADAALRMQYRWYDDSWDINAHSVHVEWEQALGRAWTFTPSLRYYTQSAAAFYSDPPFGSGFDPERDYSGDARLSAFGAWTLGLKLGVPLPARWRADVEWQFYRQDTRWRWFGDGSPGLDPVSARIVALGLTRTF
jgi:hypothetical protein